MGGSWFESRHTAGALKAKFGVEFTGRVNKAHAGFPIEAMRRILQSLERGQSCVFTLEGEDVWAVGWSNGASSEGEPSQKETATVKIPRPKIIARITITWAESTVTIAFRKIY